MWKIYFFLRVSYSKVVGKSDREILTPVMCEVTWKLTLGSFMNDVEICSNK